MTVGSVILSGSTAFGYARHIDVFVIGVLSYFPLLATDNCTVVSCRILVYVRCIEYRLITVWLQVLDIKMANRTVKDAKTVHGTNPQYLIEKIIRSRIYDNKFWKEECFALSAELLVDKAMLMRFIGGVFGGNIKPTPFLCLTLKMLQIQPEKDIIVEFIKNEEFKYVRALGAFYMRLTGSSVDCYKYLEPLLADSRKLRKQNRDGQFELLYIDDFIDSLLRDERVCDVILPRIQSRHVLEENNELEPKVSILEEDIEEGVESSDEEEPTDKRREKEHRNKHSPVKEKRRDREREKRNRDRDRRDRDRSDRRDRDRHRRSRSHDRERSRRHRSRSPYRK